MSHSKPQMPSVRLRPGDRVRNYILSQEGNEQMEGGRLPTMRDLAAHLSVSLATVQSVYRALKDEGRITTRPGDGTYLVSASQPATPKNARRRLYLNFVPRQPESMPESENSLQTSYYGALLQALAHSDLRFDLSILDAGSPAEEQAKTLFRCGELDAMLIFPFRPCQPLIDTCDAEGIPYVTIHPANPATSENFVTPDFFEAGCRVGRALHAGKRRRVAVFSYGSLLSSSTGWALLGGVSNGLLEVEGPDVTLENAHFSGPQSVDDKMREWLYARRDTLPDAFICHRANTYEALLALLEELNVSVPEEASVVSILHGSQDGAATVGLTRLAVGFDQVCEAAIALLLRRLEEGNPPLPGQKYPIGFAGGTTTTRAENRVLGIA